jgi:hypothetical protein
MARLIESEVPIAKPIVTQSMQDFLDKQEVLREKRKEIFEKMIDIQINLNGTDYIELEKLNKQLESLRKIENELPTRFEK